MIRVASLAIVLFFVGCASAPQRMVTRAASPAYTFSCYVQVLSGMEFSRIESDRGSGVIQAERRPALFDGVRPVTLGGVVRVTVTIVPATSGDGSDVTVAISGQGGASEYRDMETLSEACVPPTPQR